MSVVGIGCWLSIDVCELLLVLVSADGGVVFGFGVGGGGRVF